MLTALFERTYAGISPAARRVFLTLCGWRSLVPQIGLEAVLLRKENDKLDVEDAIKELSRSSLIDLYVNDDEQMTFLGVPLTAALFGRRKLSVSPMSPAIEDDLKLLMAFGASKQTDVLGGAKVRIERLFRHVSNILTKAGESLDMYVPILEFLARRHPQGWILLARLHEESGGPDWAEHAKEAVRKYLESTSQGPERLTAWRKLAWLCEVSRDLSGEAHALVELARIDGVSFGMISNAANRLNGLFTGPSDGLEFQAKRVMATRIIAVMELRVDEADATDLSRMAWLYLHLKDEAKARECTRRGLMRQPANSHLSRLADRLGLTTCD